MMDDNTFGVEPAKSQNRLKRWADKNRPALTATAWVWFFFFILALIALFTGWASLPVTLGLQIVLSFAAGYIAGRIERQTPDSSSSPVRQGMLAGVYLQVTTALVILVVAVLVGIGSFGALIPLLVPYFLALPPALLFSAGFGAFGARLAGRVSKK